MEGDSQNHLRNIDVNDLDFYNNLQDEIEYDLARLQKNVKILTELRLTAAEMEVESALLYHAELWYDIEDLKKSAENNTEVNDSLRLKSSIEEPVAINMPTST